jgi:aminoglycoside phosphotransferase (APT) family kinase protein
MIDRFQSYFEGKFPEWDGIRVSNLTDITSGWETEIIAFDLEYSFQNELINDHLIARVYPGDVGTYRANAEFLLLNSLYSVGYPVPRVLLVDTSSEILERPFIIMQRVIGSTMMDQMVSESGLIDPKMADLFSTLFVQLHRLDWRTMTIIPEYYLHSDSQSLFREHLDAQSDHITRYGVEFLSPIIDWLRVSLREIEFLPISLLHRDFHPMNILLDQNGNPFVIDWTAATLGDPRIDIAWTQLLSKLHFGHRLHDLVLEKYQRIAGMNLDDMDYFTIDACLRRLSDILISLRAGAESLGMRESTTDEMKRGIGMLEEMHDTVKRITGITIDEIRSQIDHYRMNP